MALKASQTQVESAVSDCNARINLLIDSKVRNIFSPSDRTDGGGAFAAKAVNATAAGFATVFLDGERSLPRSLVGPKG